MKIYTYILIIAAVVIQSKIVWAEESEEQKLSDAKKSEEMQKFAEFQKLKELQKFLELQKLYETKKNPEHEFLENGFNSKHYRVAKKLNLDLENYKNYRSNKKNKKRGFIFLGAGGATGLAGMMFFCDAADSDNYYHDYSNHSHYKQYKNDCIITGVICSAASVGLTIAGIIRFLKLKDVVTNNGSMLSLMPKADFLNKKYGADLSFTF